MADKVQRMTREELTEVMSSKKGRKGKKGKKGTRPLSDYNLFVRKAHTFPEVKALPANQRMKRIGELWRLEKQGMVKGAKPVKNLVERAAEVRQAEADQLRQEETLKTAKSQTVKFLEKSKMFPIRESQGVTQEEIQEAEKSSETGTGMEGGMEGGTETVKRTGDCADSKPRMEGERHAIRVQYDKERKAIDACFYNFLGPGTKVETRTSRGDKGINDLDDAAMIHDLDYLRLMRKLNRGGTVSKREVRDVDDAFLNRIRESQDDPKMRALVLALFKAKYAGEDSGVIDYLKFVRGGGV